MQGLCDLPSLSLPPPGTDTHPIMHGFDKSLLTQNAYDKAQHTLYTYPIMDGLEPPILLALVVLLAQVHQENHRLRRQQLIRGAGLGD